MNRVPLICVAVGILLATTGASQTEPEHAEFDVASVRVNRTPDRPSTRYDVARVELHKASMKHLVRRAWPVPDYQVVWPSWVADQRGAVGYDVSVTFPRDTSPQRLQLMFQDLMATRFGLAAHWETRDVRVLEVTVSPRGLKLSSAANPAAPTDYPKYSSRMAVDEWHVSSKLGDAPSGLTIAGFLEVMNGMQLLDRPLVDSTGIPGYFDIDLAVPPDPTDRKPAAGEILSAMEKQLGLKATAKTLSLRVLVIDRLERMPTEN